MIPSFNENGYLPAGVHLATFEEVEYRFGTESEIRRVQSESLRWLLDSARRAGVKRLIVNGSYVTNILEPNDVDCVLLISEGFPHDTNAEAELTTGLPFLELNCVGQIEFELLVNEFFATDRFAKPKGVVEIKL